MSIYEVVALTLLIGCIALFVSQLLHVKWYQTGTYYLRLGRHCIYKLCSRPQAEEAKWQLYDLKDHTFSGMLKSSLIAIKKLMQEIGDLKDWIGCLNNTIHEQQQEINRLKNQLVHVDDEDDIVPKLVCEYERTMENMGKLELIERGGPLAVPDKTE